MKRRAAKRVVRVKCFAGYGRARVGVVAVKSPVSFASAHPNDVNGTRWRVPSTRARQNPIRNPLKNNIRVGRMSFWNWRAHWNRPRDISPPRGTIRGRREALTRCFGQSPLVMTKYCRVRDNADRGKREKTRRPRRNNNTTYAGVCLFRSLFSSSCPVGEAQYVFRTDISV